MPLAGWTSVALVTNVSGTVSFSEAPNNLGRRFYRARQLP